MNNHVMPVLVAILILTGTGLASQAFVCVDVFATEKSADICFAFRFVAFES